MKLNFWQYTTIGLAIVVILLSTCNSCQKNKISKLEKNCNEKLAKTDTVIIRDTIEITVTMPVYVPQPYRVIEEKPVPVYVEGKEVIREVDTAKILKDYYATAFYKDTVSIQNGQVIINDQISRNRIKQRQVTANLQKEIVTNYVTNTIEERRKNELYLGFIGQGGGVPMAGGASLMFIQKKGFGIEAGALINTEKKLIYQGSFKIGL